MTKFHGTQRCCRGRREHSVNVALYRKVKADNDQEMAQSERHSYFKNQSGEKLN